MSKEFEDGIDQAILDHLKDRFEISENMLAGKNDRAWALIFDKYDVCEKIQHTGEFEISASTINMFREARLMAKFDHYNNLPEIFKKFKISILPNSRGTYILSTADAYHKFKDIESPEIKMTLPAGLETLDYSSLTSEAKALSAAYISGILSNFLEEDEEFFYPTVNGRMKSGVFDFTVNTISGESINISVNNAQIEIDGGYEGRDISLIEAKNVISSDFMVRQIYYPYRTFHHMARKAVRPIYLVYTDGTYQLYEYRFPNPYQYNDLALIKSRKYTLDPTSISKNDVERVLSTVPVDYSTDKRKITFPQANDFLKVINLCEHLLSNPMNSDEISTYFEFDKRQSDYYGNAARYIGLVQRDSDRRFELTQDGAEIFSLDNRRDRHLEIIKRILNKPVFRDCYLNVEAPYEELKRIIQESMHKHRSDLSDYTIERRASTVIKWCQWIQGLYT